MPHIPITQQPDARHIGVPDLPTPTVAMHHANQPLALSADPLPIQVIGIQTMNEEEEMTVTSLPWPIDLETIIVLWLTWRPLKMPQMVGKNDTRTSLCLQTDNDTCLPDHVSSPNRSDTREFPGEPKRRLQRSAEQEKRLWKPGRSKAGNITMLNCVTSTALIEVCAYVPCYPDLATWA